MEFPVVALGVTLLVLDPALDSSFSLIDTLALVPGYAVSISSVPSDQVDVMVDVVHPDIATIIALLVLVVTLTVQGVP